MVKPSEHLARSFHIYWPELTMDEMSDDELDGRCTCHSTTTGASMKNALAS